MNKNLELKSRHIKTILFMLENRYPISSAKIAEKTGISKNTLKHDLDIISRYVSSKNLTLLRKPRVGIYIEGNDSDKKSLFEELTNLKNKEEFHYDKKSFLIKLFLTSKKIPTVEDLCEMLSISRPITVKYVKLIKE